MRYFDRPHDSVSEPAVEVEEAVRSSGRDITSPTDHSGFKGHRFIVPFLFPIVAKAPYTAY